MGGTKTLLIGDNPFHNVSHLSQEKAITRDTNITNPYRAAELVKTATDNGANGFMFTVSDTTLSILRSYNNESKGNEFRLYAIVPYVYEYIRTAAVVGGIPGLARKTVREVIFSANYTAVYQVLKGMAFKDQRAILKGYLAYEISKIKMSGKSLNLHSVLFHEVITDMALSLNMEWIFKTHIEYMRNNNIVPGFETRNFSYCVTKLKEWGIDLDDVVLAAPFNSLGFQMCPSKEENERSLTETGKAEIIAFSVLAAGYLKVDDAIDYISALPNISGIAVGVSKPSHASDTFKVLHDQFNT